MNKNTKQILADLYAIDESFREHEPELVKIINKLLVSKPDTKFDKKFAHKLRAELFQQKKVEVKQNFIINLTNMFNTKQYSYAGAGVAVIVLSIIVWQYSGLGGNKLAFNQNITKVGDQAFGSLVNIHDDGASQLGREEAMNLGIGAGGGGGDGIAMSESAVADGKMIMPNPYSFSYKFIYEGDELSINEEEMAVLKRVKEKNISSALAQGLKNFDFGDINLNKFSNLSLQSISLAEEKDFGYAVHINPLEGMISINENYTYWQNHRPVCRDQKCYEAQRLKPVDIPADQELINIVAKFLKEKNINIKNYGEPEVRKDWLLNARPGAEMYVPDMVSVVYPLIISDKKVYEEGGQVAGMNISVDVHLKRATNMNYMTQNYESSNYKTEIDTARILKFAEQGGRYSNRYFAPTPDSGQAEIKELKIGTPTLSYVKIWQFNEDKRENIELLVPAFVFPILEKPEGVYFWQENIVIPIIKELLDEADKQNNNNDDVRILPEPVPMPLEEPVSSSDNSVSINKEDIDE
ncbi:MAG: hypothetical protein ABIH48_00515 [Candidatus Falkowbacteria bacterium]